MKCLSAERQELLGHPNPPLAGALDSGRRFLLRSVQIRADLHQVTAAAVVVNRICLKSCATPTPARRPSLQLLRPGRLERGCVRMACCSSRSVQIEHGDHAGQPPVVLKARDLDHFGDRGAIACAPSLSSINLIRHQSGHFRELPALQAAIGSRDGRGSRDPPDELGLRIGAQQTGRARRCRSSRVPRPTAARPPAASAPAGDISLPSRAARGRGGLARLGQGDVLTERAGEAALRLSQRAFAEIQSTKVPTNRPVDHRGMRQIGP